MKRLILCLAICALLFTPHPASADSPFDPIQPGFLSSVVHALPSSPTTVSKASGWVSMSPGATTFTTAAWGANVEVEFDVDFAASNAAVSNCVAGIVLSGGSTISAWQAGGYVTPSFTLGNFVSAHAVGVFSLYPSTSYTITPQVSAQGTPGATCSMTSALLSIHIWTLWAPLCPLPGWPNGPCPYPL
jgi:hypothetical protein